MAAALEPCRRCALCKSGRYNLCRDVVFMSAPPINGTFCEYAAVAADFAHPLPDSVDDESGAFVEPLAVGVQACTRARLTAASTVAVVGAGPIGLVTMIVARGFGRHGGNPCGIGGSSGAHRRADGGQRSGEHASACLASLQPG